MIYLFTDFGYAGPYAGEMRAAVMAQSSTEQVIDLMHDAPAFNPKASAYLLAALSRRFKQGDGCVAVVDPGVGINNRHPLIVVADGVTYSGPDNGLFSQICKRAKHCEVYEINWQPENISNTFHGRDLFAPALIKVMSGREIELDKLQQQDLTGIDWPASLHEIIYIDHYGNCITGIDQSAISEQDELIISGQNIKHKNTFSDVKPGEAFWYINSMGLVELAINQGNAANDLQLATGDELVLS